MCLDRVYRGKEKREALAKLPDEFPVWKLVRCFESGEYYTAIQPCPIWAGELRAIYLGRIGISHLWYRAGWHANISRNGTVAFSKKQGYARNRSLYHIIKCQARKKHIRSIGKQDGHTVVVLSHITYPRKYGKPPEGTKR